MKSHLVDRERWPEFAGQFSREHEGWKGSLQVREPGSPMHVAVDDSPFRAITVVNDKMVFAFGAESTEFAHVMRDPRWVVTAENTVGDGASIVVDGGDRGRCVLALFKPEELS